MERAEPSNDGILAWAEYQSIPSFSRFRTAWLRLRSGGWLAQPPGESTAGGDILECPLVALSRHWCRRWTCLLLGI